MWIKPFWVTAAALHPWQQYSNSTLALRNANTKTCAAAACRLQGLSLSSHFIEAATVITTIQKRISPVTVACGNKTRPGFDVEDSRFCNPRSQSWERAKNVCLWKEKTCEMILQWVSKKDHGINTPILEIFWDLSPTYRFHVHPLFATFRKYAESNCPAWLGANLLVAFCHQQLAMMDASGLLWVIIQF